MVGTGGSQATMLGHAACGFRKRLSAYPAGRYIIRGRHTPLGGHTPALCNGSGLLRPVRQETSPRCQQRFFRAALGWTETFDTDAPLSKWQHSASFDTARECEEPRAALVRNYIKHSKTAPGGSGYVRCTASDYPRLKGKLNGTFRIRSCFLAPHTAQCWSDSGHPRQQATPAIRASGTYAVSQ